MGKIQLGATIVLLVGLLVAVTHAAREKCDLVAASSCEAHFRRCKLFQVTPGDTKALCQCGLQYYGECLAKAGCTIDKLRECTGFIAQNDCPNGLTCGINCASDGAIVEPASVIPVTNYGRTHIRLRFCHVHVDQQYFSDYK